MNAPFAVADPTPLAPTISALIAALGVLWLVIVILLAITWFAWLILPFILWRKFNQVITEMQRINVTLGWLGETAIRTRPPAPLNRKVVS